MGLGGLHIWHLLIILGIVIVIFGTKRLKTLGSDLGGAIKGFRKAMDQDDKSAPKTEEQKRLEADANDAEFTETKDKERHG